MESREQITMRNLALRNPEFDKTIKGVLISFIICSVLFIGLSAVQWNKLNKDILYRNYALIGQVLEKNPYIEDEVMNAFIYDYDSKYVKKGMEIARKYGYTENLPLNISPTIKNYFSINIFINFIFYLILVTIIIKVVSNQFTNIYEKIDNISKGAEKIMEGHFNVIFCNDDEGEISKLGFQFNQMTKRLKITLDELNNEKEFLKNMVSNISHQLKTPLTSLKMFNELLLDGAVDDPSVKQEFLEKSFIQLDRMEWLIHTLLKMARLETGVIELSKDESDLSKTINDEVKSLIFSANRKRQSIEVNNIDEPINFVHDRRWISEALRNIIKNAIDYTQEGGKISIDVDKSKTFITIKIKDNGVGIDPRDISHIFERFYQGANSKKLSKKGTGIGLSLSKLIIEKHGGIIEVESEQGKGSEFTIIFPRI